MPLDEKALIVATKPFTVEDRRSVTATVSTFAILGLLTAVAFAPVPWWVKLAASVAEALVMVRAFCLFHDYQHGAILRRSAIARAFFWCFGQLILVPASVWRETHNYHHAHTAQLVGSHIGSYAMLTPRMYQSLTPTQRWLYRAARHPLNIISAVFTVFFLGMCVRPFLRAPKKHAEALTSAVVVLAMAAASVYFGRFDIFVFGWLIPMAIADMSGAYLFYAQHNFPDAVVEPRETWSYAGAALHASSFFVMGPLMNWCTANIGYHHVHHLNAAIPFYRLPETMGALPALQTPGRTTFTIKDIVANFRLKLWDPQAGKMVGYPTESASSGSVAAAT